MNTFSLVVTLVAVLIIVLATAYVLWTLKRARDRLNQWAQANSYRIIESDRRSFFRGPYFWRASESQAVFRVTVQDNNGNTRRGWVRIGSYLFGLHSSQVGVTWDE